jgi:hypothetical protein
MTGECGFLTFDFTPWGLRGGFDGVASRGFTSAVRRVTRAKFVHLLRSPAARVRNGETNRMETISICARCASLHETHYRPVHGSDLDPMFGQIAGKVPITPMIVSEVIPPLIPSLPSCGTSVSYYTSRSSVHVFTVVNFSQRFSCPRKCLLGRNVREFIQAKVEKNVKQKERQAKSYPPCNDVVSYAETCSGSLPDRSMMSRAMLRWVAMPSSRKSDERQVARRSPLRSAKHSAQASNCFLGRRGSLLAYSS